MLAFLGKYSCEYTINKHPALSHFNSHYIVISTPFFWRSGNQVRMEKSHLQAFSANGILCVLPVCVWITAVTESSPTSKIAVTHPGQYFPE